MIRALESIAVGLLIALAFIAIVLYKFKVTCPHPGEFCVSDPYAVAGYFVLVGALLVALGWIAGVYEMRPMK